MAKVMTLPSSETYSRKKANCPSVYMPSVITLRPILCARLIMTVVIVASSGSVMMSRI